MSVVNKVMDWFRVDSNDEEYDDVELNEADEVYDEDEDYEEDDLSYIEMECPNCSEVVEIDEELLFDDSVDVVCPNCHAVILSSEDDCDCGCGCGCEDDDYEDDCGCGCGCEDGDDGCNC